MKDENDGLHYWSNMRRDNTSIRRAITQERDKVRNGDTNRDKTARHSLHDLVVISMRNMLSGNGK